MINIIINTIFLKKTQNIIKIYKIMQFQYTTDPGSINKKGFDEMRFRMKSRILAKINYF